MGSTNRHFDDPIPIWTAWLRKLITIRSVSSERHEVTMTPSQFIARLSELQKGAAGSSDMGRRTAAFWKIENLASSVLKHGPPRRALRDPRLPEEVRPIAHCGMGLAAVEVGSFQAPRIADVIDTASKPEYRLFAYESLGAMLSLYERDAFGLASRVFALLGLLPLVPLERPREIEFLNFFDPEIRRLIAHGYGRMLYFKHANVSAAIRDAVRRYTLDSAACVQGVAFAYSMVNNSDLRRILQAGERLRGLEPFRPFENGLIYALEFWEWMTPGFLQGFQQGSGHGSSLVEIARFEIDCCRRRGSLAPFIVESRRDIRLPR